MTESDAQLSAVIYGDPGVGKSRLSATSPAPRLVIDAEGSHRFIKANKIKWNPLTDPVPELGDWDTCLVAALDWDTFERIYAVLRTGNHPFKSVVIDTLTELQKRLVDDVSGVDQTTQPQWGSILRSMDDYLRKFRDLLDHPSNPLTAVIIVAHADFNEKVDKFEPLLRGSIKKMLPGHFDLIGYMFLSHDEEGNKKRGLLIEQTVKAGRTYVAKDRTDALTIQHGPVIDNPDISDMITTIHTYLNEGN